jgi:pilus assembly protein CpaB
VKTRGLVLAVAFLLAATATLAVFMYVKGVKDEASGGGGKIEVVVAKEDIPAGTRLDDLVSEGQFETVAFDEAQVVDGAITTLSELQGRETAFPILAGEQISSVRLRGSTKQLPGGTLGIPAGYVALTVPLESANTAGSAVKRGDHVIVYGHFPKDAENITFTSTLVNDVQILKVDDPIGGTGASGAATLLVTMALKPTDAEKVVFGQGKGEVWLGLLPPGQTGVHSAPVVIGKVLR